MEWITKIWSACETWLEPLLTFLVSTGAGTFIGGLIINKWFKNNDVNRISSNVSNAVVGGIANKNILIDLQSYNKTQLNEIEDRLTNKFVGAFDTINRQTILLGDIAEVVALFKAVSTEQRSKIIEDLKAIKPAEQINIKEQKPIVVKIEQIPEKQTETRQLF